MPDLSESKLGTVRALIQAAPDSAIRDLEAALSAGDDRHEAMRMIHRMVNDEAVDRRARYVVFAPLMALCVARPEGATTGLYFPTMTAKHLWRGLKAEAPQQVRAVVDVFTEPDFEELPIGDFDALCALAAVGLRAKSNTGYAAAADVLERSQPGGVEAFAACLDLTAVARGVLEKLPEWLVRFNEERTVAARLAFRDAVNVSEDAAPRLLEILYAHLTEPWLILRLISAVMHRPGDRYVATSEMASFGERLMDDIDVRLKRVGALNADGGAAAGAAAAHDVNLAAAAISEFDKSFELSRDGPWGARLNQQKRSLAKAVEGRLKAVDREIQTALPTQSAGFKKRGTRPQPRLTDDPDPRLVEHARAFLTFMNAVRGSADLLGFGSMWGKTEEAVEARLATYVEDLLDKLHEHEEEDNPERIRLYLDIAAEFLGLASGDKAAQIVRRRAAAA